MNSSINKTITLTIALPSQIEVTPTTGGRQMKATVHIDYQCEDTLGRFLLFDIRRRAENMVRQDGASQTTYSCVVSGGKLQRMDKSSTMAAALRTERLNAVNALVASGMQRDEAVRLLGYDELLT
jgi:hypothetical protein